MENLNKLIAEFMGAKPIGKDMYMFPDIKIDGGGLISNNRHVKDLHYHDDWNWLMEVVEKIRNESFDYYVTITNSSTKIERVNFDNPSGMETIVHHHVNTIEKEQNRIRVTYSAIIDFLNWRKTKDK